MLFLTCRPYADALSLSYACSPLPGATQTKPGAATLPFFGIDPVLLDPTTGKEIEGNEVEGVLCVRKPWPSIARTVYGDHKRFLDTYMNPYPGYYFTGDGAGRDHDGYYWIRGRVDDVINVSGHRLSTAEIESALIQHNGVAETAVVGIPDELTGQAVVAYVSLKPEFAAENPDEPALLKELVLQVRKTIGAAFSNSTFSSSPRPDATLLPQDPSLRPRSSSLSTTCPRCVTVPARRGRPRRPRPSSSSPGRR
mgnify:CR=1 FL=1